MTFQRGFKTRANELALEVRAELGLRAYDPICPFAVASDLAIPVWAVEDLVNLEPQLAAELAVLAGEYRSAFSAVTVFDGFHRCIVHNENHAPVRRRSNVAHELAHALLMHPPHPPLCSAGSRIYKRELEEEASWLGPVLLVPNEAARWAVARGIQGLEAAEHFDVSQDLWEFRFRMSGAARMGRARPKATG